jgi:hypothetical protein
MVGKKKKAEKKQNGRPEYVPSDQDRGAVQALSGFGLSQDDIAEFLDVAPKTLRKHYDRELVRARPALMALAGGGLFDHLKRKEAWAIKFVHGKLGKKYGWTERPEIVFPSEVFWERRSFKAECRSMANVRRPINGDGCGLDGPRRVIYWRIWPQVDRSLWLNPMNAPSHC